jgi:hypothetical protein
MPPDLDFNKRPSCSDNFRIEDLYSVKPLL